MGKIVVIGFDTFSEAREAVKKGVMVATVAQSPAEMGRQGIEKAVHILKSERIPAESVVMIKLVTRENADQTTK